MTIIWPLLMQVLLSLLVWWTVLVSRFREAGRKQIAPQKLSTRQQAQSLLTDSANPNNNLINLFELPVLFYVLCLLMIITNTVTTGMVICCWLFVAGRAVHSVIHMTYNHVMHRFYAYFISTLSLQVLFGLFVYQLFLQG